MMPKRNASFVLLPESWSSEMQKSTDLELKLMSQRVQKLKDPFRELANSLDKEWAKTYGSSEGILSRFKDNQRINFLSSRMESFATLAFRPSLTLFSPPPPSKPINKIAAWKVPSYHIDLPSFTKAVVQEFDHKEEVDYEGSIAELKIPIDLKEIRVALRKLGSQKGVSRLNKYVVDKWEPLRRLRVTLMELELAATASRSPREFFDNLKKTEFFENTKRTLKISISNSAALKFSKERRSILAVDDITRFIPEKEADIAILEEPEHLTWYHHGARWTQRFRHVVGIVHTNYLEYAKREKNGPIQAFFLKHVNNWVTNIYCHKVVKLSAATQKFPKSIVCNVHGVSPKFLDIGQKIANQKVEGNPFNMEGAYYLGKMVWGKGYYELLDLLAKYKKDLHELKLDVFGTGEDSEAIKAEALKHNLAIKFYEGKDHADPSIYRYKVFINPSVSDVVCTTTAEALAMGKIVVCTDHPSNEFFNSFPNCWKYKNSEEFVQKVKQAMESEPLPLTEEQCYLLSWEAATDRFISSADLDSIHPKHVETCVQLSRKQIPPLLSMHRFINDGLFLAHYCLTGLEVARLATGAIPGTIHMDEEQCKDLGVASPLRQRAASRVW